MRFEVEAEIGQANRPVSVRVYDPENAYERAVLCALRRTAVHGTWEDFGGFLAEACADLAAVFRVRGSCVRGSCVCRRYDGLRVDVETQWIRPPLHEGCECALEDADVFDAKGLKPGDRSACSWCGPAGCVPPCKGRP